jgi:polyhydroxyalkanoate synthase
MSNRGGTKQDAEKQDALARKWSALAERSQRLVQDFAERQSAESGFSVADPKTVMRAFAELGARMMADPVKLADAQMRLWQDSIRLWQATAQRMLGEEAEPVAEPERSDRRFRDEAWNEQVVFDYIKQSYLLTSRWVQDVVGEVEGLEPGTRDKVDFYTRQLLSAAAPSNFALTNPAVLRKAADSGGENLVKGLENLLGDLERGKGRLQISMTDAAAFEVGKNVAASPGKVIYQNELMQLIQYAPSSDTAHLTPLLFVPPWINKFYVMDLQPKNSLIKWAVDQGHTLFVISWVNPRKDLAHKSFEDYMREGPLAALDAIEQATGESEANILGFCIGGILVVALLAYMAATGDERIKSATFLATMVDFQDAGEVSVFIDEEQLEALEQHVAEKGYLEGHHMADMFNMMRENDLIWSFVVNNYRLMKPGGLELGGVPIDARKVQTPTYFLCTKEDHIAPWRSGYPATQVFSGPVRFVLGGSGHIAGVINPPVANKYCYWTNAKLPPDPDEWLAKAKRHEGSWWTDWGKWLARHGGPRVPARQPGDGSLAPIEDAPGSYVKVRASE